jgi:hypothetical protein
MAEFSFRQFQEELRKLDGPQPTQPIKPAGKPLNKKELEAQRLSNAKAEFLALRERHQWSIADVVAFFPEEEGVNYLLELLSQPKKKRVRKAKEAE